jgi:hypothetical protein
MEYLSHLRQVGAVFDESRLYRYALWREWSELGMPLTGGNASDIRYVLFVGLNPSTADAETNDPTIRRCLGFARTWGYQAVVMVNLFAYRSTDPHVLRSVHDPVGRDTDLWLTVLADNAALAVACWGSFGLAQDRGAHVRQLLPNLVCLGTTKDGAPRHPLYLAKTTKVIPYSGNDFRPENGGL